MPNSLSKGNQTQGGIGAYINQTVFNQLYATNPEFKQFADSMQGKTPEQAFRERGLDFNQVRKML